MQAGDVFDEESRANRQLSQKLLRLPAVRQLLHDISRTKSIDELDRFAAALPQRIENMRVQPPSLGRPMRGEESRGAGWRDLGDHRVQTTAYRVQWIVEDGEPELLMCWPDEVDRPLRSSQHEVLERIGGADALQHGDREDVDEYFALRSLWRVEWVSLPGGVKSWALCTTFEFTHDEFRTQKSVGLRALADQRFERVGDIIDAIAEQTTAFFDTVLQGYASSGLAGRRQRLLDEQDFYRDLELPAEWQAPRIELEAEPPAKEIGASPSPESSRRGPAPLEVSNGRYRLSTKSLAEMLQILRRWATAVETNPRGWHGLDEDQISDLLCATFNAATPGADREAFSRNGKTDVQVRASALPEGAGPEPAFILETKWATSKRAVHEALQKQLFRYVSPHSPSAVLVALYRRADHAEAVAQVGDWARAVDSYVRQSEGPIAGWTHYTYAVNGGKIEICIATIHVPQSVTRDGRPK